MAHAQKPDFVFRKNGRVHLKRRGCQFSRTTGSRGVRLSGSNAGYTMFRGSVKGTGYLIHSPVSSSLPLRASRCAITFQPNSTSCPIQPPNPPLVPRYRKYHCLFKGFQASPACPSGKKSIMTEKIRKYFGWHGTRRWERSKWLKTAIKPHYVQTTVSKL